ncbi:Uncharacterised protein [Cedecea neteri]|uniref:Uncharacterized protein n=1 Tax=Cedecea neteri TaxID=158822 RepID=A0A2X2V6E2_9ENTR|nr:Uncharacterised protein [Cedecea neteri]
MCLILEPLKKQTPEMLSNSFIKFILLMTTTIILWSVHARTAGR